MESPGQGQVTITDRNLKPETTSTRREVGRRQGAKILPERKKPTIQPTHVYVRIHDVINDIGVLGDVLTAKVNTPGVKMTPTETCITRSDCFTFCILTCESKAQAKRLKYLIMKDRTLFTPLIDCSFSDFVSAEIQRQVLDRTKADLRKKVEREFDNRSEVVLRLHDQKLTETEQRIDIARGNMHNLYTIEKTRQEIAALEHKQEELQRQKREFLSALKSFQQQLVSVLAEDSYKQDVQDLRKRFGVECCRLEKALPMYARRQDIVQLVEQNQVSILLAETGSGKSTQVVQYLLDAGLADRGTIVCTQPRKVAAMSLALRVAQELASNVGREVGYKAGTRVKTSSSTKVVYMTDHALLNECLADPDLKAFSCVVVDEAHERSLFTDLLLSMVKRCASKRPDLRVIITSATIDPQVFVDFFGSCPVMKVSGRAFPVDVIWQHTASEENNFENYMDAAISKAVDIHEKQPPGDILVFLTSAMEIQKCCDLFQQKMKDRTDFKCFQLHGQLQADEQQKVFEPLDGNKRKIVFATNCAETSITIDGIKYVVDTGVAKEMRYDPKRNMRSLNVTVISQSSAEQRKGRAGRTAPGQCYRLYSQRSFQAMDTISLPEILKTHLGHALLKLAELGVTPDMYDFVQSPSQETIDAALRTLHQLGAMDNGVITETGRWIAKLPFDPKLGLMTVHGRQRGLLYDTIVLAALVSAGSSLFYRGVTDEEHENLNKSKIKFCHHGGDSITALQVYRAWQQVDEKQKNQWCVSHSVNARVIRGARDTVNEVCKILEHYTQEHVQQQLSQAQEDTDDRLRKILFLCNASSLCHFLGRQRAGYFAGQACRQVYVHPSSALCFLATCPQWLVYDQLLHTSRHFITGVTPVQEEWLKELSKERCGLEVDQISQIKLVNTFTQPAGSRAYFAMVGPRHGRLQQFQERCSAQDSSVVVIEGSQETGKVRVLCTKVTDTVKEVTQELTQLAQQAVQDVQHEVWEVPIGKEHSGLQVVLGQGAGISNVDDIVMPHETRKVFIHRASEDATEDVMQHKFRAYGEVSKICQFSGGTVWGFLVFRTAAQARAAAEATKDDERDVAKLEYRRPTKHNAEFRARLSWNRRHAKGFGFVTVSPVYLSKCMAIGYMYIGRHLINIKKDRKNENNLYLRKLPWDVTEDQIKQNLLRALGESKDAEGIVEQVSIPRQTVGKTHKQELTRLENEIQRKIESHLKASTVQVTVFQPKTDKTAMFTGEARFSDPMEGLAACKTLHSNFSLNAVQVSVEPVVLTSLRVGQAVFEACRPELDIEMTGFVDKGVEVVVKQQKTGSYVISLKASDAEDIVQARTLLNNIVKGDVLECSNVPALLNLLTSSGRQMLKDVEKETSAHIIVDNRLTTVSIHGTTEACNKARMRIDSYLQEVEKGRVEEVSLRGDGKPPALLKALHQKYGDDLDVLRQHTGLHTVLVDFRRHVVKLTGPPESLQKAKQAVEEVEKTLGGTCTQNTVDEDESIDCAACLCPIDKGDLYRLEACSHPFCITCIARQVTVSIQNRHIPVVCCHEGCDLPLAWRDFFNLSQKDHIRLPALASAAISAFVLANRHKARFCVTPDCPAVYRVTSEAEAGAFFCPECGVGTCTACHEQAHDGMSCAALRSSKDAEKGFEDWMGQDRQNRKVCPGCDNPIEKTEGCNKMRCVACGTVFCWLCARKFHTDDECYDHLAKWHGGIFD